MNTVDAKAAIKRGRAMLKVPNGKNPYNVIGEYIQNHIEVIEDIIATIELDGIRTNELFMVNIQEDGYFVWQSDWYEGEQNIALIDFFPVSEAKPERENESVGCDWHKRKFERIVVEYPPKDLCAYHEYKGKPYFSIQYEENGEHIIGFGTYNPDVLSKYLIEYFIMSAIIEADKENENEN